MQRYNAAELLREYHQSKPKALLFDWDNTLVDTWPLIHAALAKTFVKWGMEPWTLAQCKVRVALSMRDAFPALFGDEWQVAGKYYIDSYKEINLERLRPLFGMEQLLMSAWRDGAYLGVVSNKTGPVLRKEAAKLGWKGYFDALVGSGDAARDKPHTDGVVMALQGLDGALSACGQRVSDEMQPHVWFVGDASVDAQVAATTGVCYYHVGSCFKCG